MEMPQAHQAARLPRARVAVRLVAQLGTGRGRSARSARADASAGVGSSRSREGRMKIFEASSLRAVAP